MESEINNDRRARRRGGGEKESLDLVFFAFYSSYGGFIDCGGSSTQHVMLYVQQLKQSIRKPPLFVPLMLRQERVRLLALAVSMAAAAAAGNQLRVIISRKTGRVISSRCCSTIPPRWLPTGRLMTGRPLQPASLIGGTSGGARR